VLAAGDPRRDVYGRAIMGSVALGVVFLAFVAATKQIRPLYAHSPWRDDPFDVAVSFSILFVPLVLALSLARLPLCRRAEPLPVARVTGLLRAGRLMLGLAWLTLGAEWISVATRSNRQSWTAVTGLEVLMLAATTSLALVVTADLRRAYRQEPRAGAAVGADSDWLFDLALLAEAHLGLLGPLRRSAAASLAWFVRGPSVVLRAHPIAVSAAVSVAFGLAVAAGHSLSEGGDAPTFALFLVVSASVMFAFVVSAGHHLGIVAPTGATSAPQRRAIDAAVAGAAAAGVALAFRFWLGWVVGPTDTSAGVPRLIALVTLVGAVVFVAVLLVECVARLHARPR